MVRKKGEFENESDELRNKHIDEAFTFCGGFLILLMAHTINMRCFKALQMSCLLGLICSISF